MSDVVKIYKRIATDKNMGFFHALKSIQSLRARKNQAWPILYLDNPKTRKPDMNAQGALPNKWTTFVTILNKDRKQASAAQTQAVIDACRTKMNEFIQGLRDVTDENGHNRKEIMEIDLGDEVELRQWSSSILSGVALEINIELTDPVFSC